MRSRTLAAVALAAAALSTGAGAAQAACAGTERTVIVCAQLNKGFIPDVDPTGSSYDDCIYLGSGPCTPVSVPIPTVTPGSGDPVIITCGGALYCNF